MSAGLLTALWYGSVVDRYGRRLVLTLSLSGSVLALLWLVAICKFLSFPCRNSQAVLTRYVRFS